MPDVLEQLAQALGPILEQQKGRQFGYSQKHDVTGVPSPYIYSHGPQGQLTWPGVDPGVFNVTMGGRSLLSQLPATPSVNTNPTYLTITGVQGDTGSEKNTVCADAPVAGLMKSCLTTSVFGRYERATQELEVNRLGARLDRADPLDLRLLNSPLTTSLPFGNLGMEATPADVLTNEVSRKFWERNVSFHRLLTKQLWRGNPATGNTAGGGYKEMTGLDLLINTGYVDAENGQACAAMDSIVRNFNHGRLDLNATVQNNLIAQIVDIFYQLKSRADRAGVSPVRWAIAMKPQLFYEITKFWPCTYLTSNCLQAGTGTPLFTNSSDAIRFRDEMRSGEYLLIDGERVDVILDDGIDEDDGNNSGGNFPKGCFETDIFFLPMSMVGGQSVLYLEYFQYQNPSIQDAIGNMILARIEGAFITWPRQTNLCIQWQSKIEPRLVLRTPWLAAKLQNVVYCPIQHERDIYPEDPYFTNGGRTTRSGPSYHSLWSA